MAKLLKITNCIKAYDDFLSKNFWRLYMFISLRIVNFVVGKSCITTMIEISIHPSLSQVCPALQVGVIEACVANSDTTEMLWNEVQEEARRIASLYTTETLSQRAAIAATRRAYRALGKDPARCRVSSEALCRRAIRGAGLYRINTLVDLLNIVSMRSGYSIGGFDADCINGGLTLGVGTADDIFNGIGRGPLNIAGLPLYRDNTGGVGTPTSDEERTKLTLSTTRLLVCINAYAVEMPLDECFGFTAELLDRYAAATEISTRILSAG